MPPARRFASSIAAITFAASRRFSSVRARAAAICARFNASSYFCCRHSTRAAVNR
jgi:hypothetical protein